MALVHVDNLVPGMVLKQNVCDRSGRMLLPEGVELTAKHLVIFKTWGVVEADITAESDSEGGGIVPQEVIDPELLAAAEAEITPLFVHNDLEHPAMKELLRLCIARRAANAR